jgi:galactokinase/mevalonate kinase-like predicted kinase
LKRITAHAPGRCGIAGNPSDMYGGSVVSCTVRERATCVIELGASTDRGIVVVNGDEREVLTSADDYVHRGDKLDIARSALSFLQVNPQEHEFTLSLDTAIPMRAGMAGSTAMLAAIVGALDRLLALDLNPYETAETMRKIEARVMKVVCGYQDQHMAVFGGLNFMTFAGKESLAQEPSDPLAVIEPLAGLLNDVPLILAHTGIQHHSGTVHKSPRERWLAGEPIVRQNYARIGQLGWMAKKALLASDWAALGALMDENHALVSELGGSGPANDRLIETARNAGAYGAKLAGAGGGGTIIALTHNPEEVGRALMDAGAETLLYPAPSPGLLVTVEE